MPSSMTLPAPARQKDFKPARVSSPASGKEIIYISDNHNTELSVVSSLITTVFGLEVSAYHWDAEKLEEELQSSDAACVIISSPLGYETDFRESIWKIVEKVFPATNKIWLAPDDKDIPSFLPTECLKLIDYSEDHMIALRFIWTIAKATGIMPLFNLDSRPH